MLKPFLKALLGWALGINYIATYRQKLPARESDKVITLALHENPYSRYIYNLIKFFEIEGYLVELSFSPGPFATLARSQYANQILRENLVQLKFGKKPQGSSITHSNSTTPKILVPNDLIPTSSRQNTSCTYDVPMAQHPAMYSKNFWNQSLKRGKVPHRSILFIGNCDATYHTIETQGLFPVISRPRLKDIVTAHPRYCHIDALDAPAMKQTGRILFIDTGQVNCDISEFRSILSQYRFFLCAPGVFMPLCHNLIEALSTGAIPIIQRQYSELLAPPLSHEINAMVFENEQDLLSLVDHCMTLSEEALEQIAQSAKAYYETYLSPRAVVSRVLDSNTTIIRMLAGKTSLELRRLKLGR